MNRVCIRCNPVTLLTRDADGNEVCRIHDDLLVVEVQPDSPLFEAPPEEPPQ